MTRDPSVPTHNEPHDTERAPTPPPLPTTVGRVLGIGLIARCVLGGSLMGLANLVPGISGGTMLVASGIYTRFINAIADLTRLRFSLGSVVLLGTVALSAGVAIGGLAGVIAAALVGFRWGMYSLFIGLTLGGAPLLTRMIRGDAGRFGAAAIVGTIAGLAIMAGLVLLQSSQQAGSAGGSGSVMLFVGGIAGASAMILPGVSGAYLLLLLGLYDQIINAIKLFVKAGTSGDIQGALDQLGVVIPVGLGVVVGIVGVSNLLRFLLRRYEKATLGVLLGLLIAAPLGLYPFRQGVPPAVGDVIKGETLTAETAGEVDPKDWRQERFTPGVVHIAGAFGLIVAGFGITLGIARLGASKQDDAPDTGTQ